MKFNFTIKQANSPFDDSAVFMRNVYMKRAVLFDCGRLGGIDNSSLGDISDVFISHTHIDHFVGFDRFLRSCLNTGNTIRFYGPTGFTRNIGGKLQSYNWNLIRDYEIIFEAVELTESGIKRTQFSAKNKFEPETLADSSSGDILLEDGFTLKYEFFDHGITSVGYRVCEPKNISICNAALAEHKFIAGAWLKNLKKMLAENVQKNTPITVPTKDGEKEFTLGDIESKVVEYKSEQDVTYITDIAPTYENYNKAKKFANGSALLIIEAVFMERDLSHSIEKRHLTTRLAKSIFTESGAKAARFLHFASRYDRMRGEFYSELYNGLDGKIYQP